MQIKDYEEELRRWETRYVAWAEPLVPLVRTCLLRINKDGYTTADYKRDRQAILDQQLAKGDPHPEIKAILDRMCAEYLTAAPRERQQCRAAVREMADVRNALLNYVSASAAEIHSPGDVDRLRSGLAAASIEDCAEDFRDVFVALAGLFVAAERAGIDPVPFFREVAQLSSRSRPRGGRKSVSKVMSEFHDYDIVSECRASSRGWPPPIPGVQ